MKHSVAPGTQKIAVLGAGSWGTALAILLTRHRPYLWDHSSARAAHVQESRFNEQYLPGVELPEGITIGSSLQEALDKASVIVFAMPSHTLRGFAQTLVKLPEFNSSQLIVNTSKGLEEHTAQRVSQILQSELPQQPDDIVSLVGPSHAEEVARGMPTSVVVAGVDRDVCQYVQELFSTDTFRVYTNDDLVGTELAVSVKNVIAIAAGICDGLGFGDNSRGALLTRGLSEMTRLGIALGAKPETFSGLAGLGDLVTTATSHHSRNRNLGERIAKGESLQQVLDSNGQVCEGVRTTRAVLKLARQHQVEMPITNEVEAILFNDKDPRQAIRDLMLRAPRPESWSQSRGVS